MMAPASTSHSAAAEARATAADLLAEARAEPVDQALDHTLWALCLVPGCRAARMLRIDLLIQSGDLEEARDALASETVRRPLSWSVAYRRARVHFLQDELEEAAAAIRFVLRSRPQHVGALYLAAQTAREAGRHDEAISLLQRARAIRPRDREIIELMAALAIESGARDSATASVLELNPPNLTLAGRLLALCGRRSDAREHFEHAFDESNDSCRQDELLSALIELVDADGGPLTPLRWRLRRSHPRAMLAYARALLRRGRAASALRLARWVARNPNHRLEAMTVIAAAAQFDGNTVLASTAVRSVQAMARTPVKKGRVADSWRRAIAGDAVRRIRQEPIGEDEPEPILLGSLLDQSVEAIQDHLARNHARSPAERAEFERHVRFGIAALDALGLSETDRPQGQKAA